MDRVAVFIDAGYLFAQGSALLTGQKRPRGELTLNYQAVVAALEDIATKVSGLSLLRIYWYDGTSTGPTPQHLTLAHMRGVKVRLGFVNRAGEQKGVDSLIVTDMISLARNRSMTDALLLSGDEDLRVGVQQAQEFGVKVHLLGIKPCRGSQSLFLLQEADSTHEWTEVDVTGFLKYTPRSVEPPTPTTVEPRAPRPSSAAGITEAALREIAISAAASVPQENLAALVSTYRAGAQIPREFDAPLLARAGRTLGTQLEAQHKRALRSEFIAECERRLGPEA